MKLSEAKYNKVSNIETHNTGKGLQRVVVYVVAFAFHFSLFTSAFAVAQTDTTALRIHSLQPIPLVSGVALGGAGTLLTFQPEINRLAVSLHDDVVAANLPQMSADDYIQYLPAIAPVALNLCGLHSRHPLGRMMMLEGGSYLLGAGWLNALKYGIGVERPDNSRFNSFPSGHTFVAFTGAELIRREYGEEYPWVAVAGYAVAIAVGAMRIYNDRHWLGDVLAGAGLGIMSITLVYWALD